MRLFVAIQFTDEMNKALMQLMHDLKTQGIRGNYSPVQNLHVTLCFIGETKDAGKIREVLSQVAYKPFKLTTAESGNFGDTLWMGVKGGQSLSGLAADIRSAFDNAGIPYAKDKFTPHITLIRKLQGNMPKLKMIKTTMMVKKVSLMKSEQVKGKTVYTEIFSF